MYARMLKESASQLTLLAVENDSLSRNAIGRNLDRFFKAITYASSGEDAIRLYKSEKFDLILVDIDTFEGDAYRFIDTIHRHDLFQAMAVCSYRSDDAELMLKLLNSQIGCFIPKPSESHTLYQILSKVCGKIHDRAILMHYIEMLENQQEKAILLSCRSECPMKEELVKPIEPVLLPILQPLEEEEDDDFMFFSPPSGGSETKEDNSIYQDYYSFLDFDDREELNDQLSDIDAALFNAFSDRGADSIYITRLGSSMMRYGNVLLHYQFFSDMGTSILEFGKTISDASEMIAERSGEFEMLISGFCSGLQTYMDEVWERESDNPKFFNDSIINDATTIMGMMAPPVVSDDDDDNMFFF